MEAAEFTREVLSELQVRPVDRHEEARYQEQMERHHYLDALAKIGQTVCGIFQASCRLNGFGQAAFFGFSG